MLLSEQSWINLLNGSAIAASLIVIPTIYVLLILELLETGASLFQDWTLATLAANIGRTWRANVARATLHRMARQTTSATITFTALTKTYVEIVELYHRQFLVPSVAAGVQIVFAVSLALTVNWRVAALLILELACLLLATTVYAPVQASLARSRLSADEHLLAGTELSPRKGVVIWFGGIGGYWFASRLTEIKAVSRVRVSLSFAEVSYLQFLTFVVGGFVVLGYLLIVKQGAGSHEQFLAFLFYSGIMMAPVVRIASFIPETREFLMARNGLRSAIAGAPQRVQHGLRSPISFKATSRFGGGDSPTDFQLEPGNRVAIVGPSGSGKTAAIMALLGFHKAAFEVSVNSVPTQQLSLELPYLGVRYLTETPAFEVGSVLANLRTTLGGCFRVADELGLFPELTPLQLTEFVGRAIAATGEPLSLGERQRVQLIRALASRPTVLLLDEALSSIEEEHERKILAKLMADTSISILVHIGHRRSVQALFKRQITLPIEGKLTGCREF